MASSHFHQVTAGYSFSDVTEFKALEVGPYLLSFFLFLTRFFPHLCLVAAVISRSHEGPGEMGRAVNIPKNDQEKMKELFKINQFNLMASDMIALNRSLPDVRLDG